MNNINAIPIFVAVAESGGFSAAANELGLSKSAVSKRISQLEDQLGIRLLHRSTRKISLTEAGEHYLEYASKALIAAQNAEDAVAQLQGEPQGKLKINIPMSFGLLQISPLIASFLKKYPKIQLDLVMDDKPINLIEQGFDLSIRAGDLTDSNLIARKLAPLHSIVCASPDYISNNKSIIHPSDLVDHNCILYSYSKGLNHWHFKNLDETLNIPVKGNYRVNSSEALKDALLGGLGIGRLPTFVAGRYIREGRLINVFTNYQMPAKSVYAIFPERTYMPAKVRVFIDYMLEALGSDSPTWDDGLF